jgi:hypothetical protein
VKRYVKIQYLGKQLLVPSSVFGVESKLAVKKVNEAAVGDEVELEDKENEALIRMFLDEDTWRI